MNYYGNNDYRNYLAHHGVLGMHWGIRRYQPYPSGYNGKGKYTGSPDNTKRIAQLEAKRDKLKAKQDKLYEKSKKSKLISESTYVNQALNVEEKVDKIDKKLRKLKPDDSLKNVDRAKEAKKTVNRFVEAEKKQNLTADVILQDKVINDYVKKSDTARELERTDKRMSVIAKEYSKQINRELKKKYGDFIKLDEADQQKYIRDGIYKMQLYTYFDNRFQSFGRHKAEVSRKYEKETREFLKSYLGKDASTKTPRKELQKVDMKNGTVETQDIVDRISIELLRHSKGVL